MNLKNRLNILSGLMLFLVFSSGQVCAEGIKELAPASSDSVMLHTNASGFGNFASYASFGTASSLNLTITDAVNDSVYIGLSGEADDFGNISGPATYSFRILDPNGVVAFGPFVVGSANDNATSWALASNGPDVNGTGGYSTNTAMFPYSRFKPTMTGDYVIQFDDGGANQIANILFYDFTVRNGGVVQTGRLWSRNWALRTPPRNPNTPPECQYDRDFNGVFYSYTMDGFVSRIDFNNSGYQGLSFTVSFGDRGPGDTGDVIEDRRSVNNMNATQNNAEHMVFLNDPDNVEYPSSTMQCGDVALLSVSCEAPDSFCINVGVTQPGQVELVLDFVNNGIYDADTTDVLLAMFFTEADTVCLPWDGLKGDGTPIEFGEAVPVFVRYSQGVQHYAGFDVEFLKNGFCVQTIRPICPGMATDLLYWDDSNITDDVNTVTIDEGDPGTGQPKIEINGCTCGVGGCRTWDNFQIGDPPTGTCVGTPFGYGENATLNTWWFASTSMLSGNNLPLVQVLITGDSVICAGDSTIFTANAAPDTVDFVYEWSGPGGFMADTEMTGFISTPGIYYVTVTDTLTNCSAVDSVELIVNDNPTTSVSFMCLGGNQQNADVDLTVSGGQPMYTYLWSNGAMTEDLSDVPPGEYSVIVTDANGCMAFDTVLVQQCCSLVVVCPAMDGGTFTCVSDVPAIDTSIVQVNEYCDNFTVSGVDTDNGGSGCPGDELIITRTFTIMDDAGNSQTCVQTITVSDNVAPTLSCPANVTIECTDSSAPGNTGTATATDNCDPSPGVVFNDVTVAGACPQEFTINRTWTATDNCGNTSTCVQTITIDDSQAPVIICPPSISIACTESTLPANTGTATAIDNCDGAPSVAFSDVSVAGACAQEGTITRTWTATDACGNSNQCIQVITVEDNVAPSITCPANLTIECSDSTDPANTGTATASDTCDPAPVVAIVNEVTIPGACPQESVLQRTWAATDDCGNSSTCLQIITIQDNIAPVITCPANITIECTGSTDPANTGSASAIDNCDPAPAIGFSDIVVGGGCPQESTISRTWTATDACGNSSSCVQIISIQDTEGPVITCPANITVECTDSTDPADTGSATAVDCDPNPTITFTDNVTPGACPQENSIERTWTATDACGNSSTCVQTITVEDSVAPTITCPPDVTAECSGGTDPGDTGVASATDNCDSAPVIGFTDVTIDGACPQGINITRTWIATDACGNTSTCVQIILLDDIEGPSIVCPTDVTIECTDSTDPANTGIATATDNCDGSPLIDFSDITLAGNCPQESAISRTWVATDGCGNSSTCVQVITIVDSTPPVITCPANLTIGCTDSTDPADTGEPTAVDNCDGAPVFSYSDVTIGGNCPQDMIITRTWTATDACGNSSTCDQIISVEDNEAPVITCPAAVTIECTESADPADTGFASATDCDPDPVITFSDVTVSGACAQERTIERTWTATDACGNASTCLQTIFVDDSNGPTVMCPADVTINCPDSTDPANTGTASATDNCDGSPSVDFSDVILPGACTESFTIQRTWTATDACGNTGTCIQNVFVQDISAPSITCPAGITVSCTSEVPAPDPASVITSDDCGGVVTVTHEGDVISNQTCADRYTLTRTYQATDDCGNTTTCEQIIIVDDQTPPTAICQDILIDFESGTEITITPEQIDGGSFDNCGGALSFSLSQTTFTCDEFIQTGSVPVTLTVTDECGNSSTCEAQVMGTGGLLEITCPNDIIVYLGAGECTAFVSYTVTADAICGGTPVLMQTDTTGLTSGDAFPIGTTIQTWIATNNSDTAECSFNIIVVEYDGPIQLACNDTINVSVDNMCEAHIFADMILEGDLYGCYDDYIISIDSIGTDTGWIVFPAFDLLGGYYQVTITDPETGNSCWGVVHLEDKIPPQIICACPVGVDGADTCQISCLEVDLLLDGNIPLHLYPEIIDNCGYTLEVTNIDDNGEMCGDGVVIVSWLVTDNAGYTASCDQMFNVLPLSPDSLVYPPNYVGPCGSSSDPDVTGWPTIGGYEITDEQGTCNLFLGYWDKPLDDCGGGSKILRTWTILDWCTQELVEGTQVIKLSDTEGPELTCPPDLSVGTDFWFCHASVSVPKPEANDNCSDVVSYSLVSSAGIVVQFGNNFVINEMPLGTHIVTWTVDDYCGNSSTCSFTITVVDDVVPVVNCDHHTIVGLTNDGPNGVTLVPAEVFDDGSYDNCGPVTFRARRMDSCIDFDWTTEGACIDDIPGGIPPVNSRDRGTVFRPCVPFACCDVPRVGSREDKTVMVELEVTDAAGNVNYCMVEVDVQDKISPLVYCPPDIEVSCEFWFPIEEGTFRDAQGNWNGNLDEDPLSDIFGNMHDDLLNGGDQSVRQPIIIYDPGNPEYSQPHQWGIDGWASDNCFSDLEVRVTFYDVCAGDNLPSNAPPGAVKLVERRFTARDNQQGFTPGVCVQRIWVIDFNPFYISDRNCNNSDPNDGVIWPCDILIDNCPDELGLTGEPVIISDACNLIGVTYEDTRFEFAEGACYKILRDWRVIDWCQYNSSTGQGLWSYTQVIKVHDDDGPEFLACPQQPVVLCVEDDGIRLPASNQVFLGENDPLSSSCSVHVTLTQPIRESCAGDVSYDVKLYPFNGPDYILVKPTTVVSLDDNHEANLIFNSEESPIQDIRRNGLPYNSVSCGDYHRILWSVEDGCGNWSHCEYLFRLEDCKQPTPVCIQGLSTVVMPVGCEVTLWAKDFNASSVDDCTPSEELLYSFSGDVYEPSRTFNSTNIPVFGAEISIDIYVADGGTDDNCNSVISWNERNKDFCTTTIVFTDNSGNCDHEGSVLYEGEILTSDQQPVEAVNVSLINNNEVIYGMSTADNGKYILVVPDEDGQRYEITPKRTDQPRNGVSTLDLVRIQKHLLGKEFFDSPYQYIAADANNNEQISAIDLIEIRKLILGIYTEFPENESWRFVDGNFQIADPQSPWPFEEVINIQYDGTPVTGLDFVAVKIGDVNNSVVANATQVLPKSGRKVMDIALRSPEEVKAGDVVDVTLTFPQNVAGFQWTLETEGLAYSSVNSGDIRISDQHTGVLDNGVITMSWHAEDLHASISSKPMAVTIQFVATSNGIVEDMITLSDKVAYAEAYTFSDEILDLRLISERTSEVQFALFQNEPNPWSGSTTISFDLPEAGEAVLTLYDMTGKTIKVIEGEYPAGRQSVQLLRKDLPSTGVLYYRLDSGHYSATKKMIRLD